jgi:hypothetical protein
LQSYPKSVPILDIPLAKFGKFPSHLALEREAVKGGAKMYRRGGAKVYQVKENRGDQVGLLISV